MKLHRSDIAPASLAVGDSTYRYIPLNSCRSWGYDIDRLPVSIRILLENALRRWDGVAVTDAHIRALAGWADRNGGEEIPFFPERILLQDFTGVPVVADLAAMRDRAAELGGRPDHIHPVVPVDLVIDHSVMVDAAGRADAVEFNVRKEFERNQERYRFLRWAQNAFHGFRVVPPGAGIVHQVNLEYLATLVRTVSSKDGDLVCFDTLVGTDSHTTMINGLGVLGWGVGGLEAEIGMMGLPLYMTSPDVVGVRLDGRIPAGVTATDLALTVTERLRKENVVGCLVEFFGSGAAALSLPDRATVSNMAPEYGATAGLFPVDAITFGYLRQTGRDESLVTLAEAYYRAQGLWADPASPVPAYTRIVTMDLSELVPSVSGPRHPQDRVALTHMKEAVEQILAAPVEEGGYARNPGKVTGQLEHGSVVIAAITSCTNTSNPKVMLGAGWIAKRAVEKGIRPPGHVKTSLTPGSRVVTDYLLAAGLLEPLEQLGFGVAGYGCCTCIGNSGPLDDEVAKTIREQNLTAAAVLSGNRNFDGRIHPLVQASYLASPMLVVAYALAGTMRIDLTSESLGTGSDGQPVYLRDLWPEDDQLNRLAEQAFDPELFRERYADIFTGTDDWNNLPLTEGVRYPWDDTSTYIRKPPFLELGKPDPSDPELVKHARILALLGDSVTTDHISPAGSIASDSPAGLWLQEQGVPTAQFNSYGSRRGNHEVMVRGTFANPRIRNRMTPKEEGGVTRCWTDGSVRPVYDAAMAYLAEGSAQVVLAGKNYGTGSSRDWAAKGPSLLGVGAVLVESFERIHRSNLVGMGILPLQFLPGESWLLWGLSGSERITVRTGSVGDLQPNQEVDVSLEFPDGSIATRRAILRLDSQTEIGVYREGGILPAALDKMIPKSRK